MCFSQAVEKNVIVILYEVKALFWDYIWMLFLQAQNYLSIGTGE